MKSNYKKILVFISVAVLTILFGEIQASADNKDAVSVPYFFYHVNGFGILNYKNIAPGETVKVPISNLENGGLDNVHFYVNQDTQDVSNGKFSVDSGSADYLKPVIESAKTGEYTFTNVDNLKKIAGYKFTVNYTYDVGKKASFTFQLTDPSFWYSVDGTKTPMTYSNRISQNQFEKGFKIGEQGSYPSGTFTVFPDNNFIAKLDKDLNVTPVKTPIQGNESFLIKYNVPGSGPEMFNFQVYKEDIKASDGSIYTGTAVTPDTFKANAGDQKITIWDGNKDITGTSYSEQGVHYVTLKAHGYNDKTLRLVVSQAPATPTQATGTVTQPQKPSSSQTSTTPGTTAVPTTGENAPVIGQVVYSVGPIYMYKKPTFSNSSRVSYYKQYKRINRPMFKVIDYAESANGALRYKVKDVNHRGDNAGNVGYITANTDFVVPAYYASVPKTKKVRVIASKGVNSYSYKSLSGKAKHYKKGTTLKVKKVVKHNLTTRYQLTNGKYITANKKLVIQR